MLSQIARASIRVGAPTQRTFVTRTAPKMAGVAKQVSIILLQDVFFKDQTGF
jgi:hypothetical protein